MFTVNQEHTCLWACNCSSSLSSLSLASCSFFSLSSSFLLCSSFHLSSAILSSSAFSERKTFKKHDFIGLLCSGVLSVTLSLYMFLVQPCFICHFIFVYACCAALFYLSLYFCKCFLCSPVLSVTLFLYMLLVQPCFICHFIFV